MDKTDFDSWLITDSESSLEEKYPQQDTYPFRVYEKNKNELREILKIKTDLINKLDKNNPSFSAEKNLIEWFFEAKKLRFNARTSYYDGIVSDTYENLQSLLYRTINELKLLSTDNKKYWQILFFNELSICYSGLRNSFISRGYAEEARKIIERDEDYREFDKQLSKAKFESVPGIGKHSFVSSGLYLLYTTAVFNQAEAEKRSYLYESAEKNFKKIVNYAIKNHEIANYNYYSAILSLCELYIDQGRGREAIAFLDILMESQDVGKDDVRYWTANLEKISALVDQSEYSKAEVCLLSDFIDENEKNSFTVKNRHAILKSGFKSLNHFARCQIEQVKNTHMSGEKKSDLLKRAMNVLSNANIESMKRRKQGAAEVDAYKHLGEIYELLGEEEKVREKLTLFLSEGKTSSLNAFASDEDNIELINACEDLAVLESYSKSVCKLIKNLSVNEEKYISYKQMLNKISEKFQKECEDRNEPQRSERFLSMINEAIGEEEKFSFLGPETIAKQEKLFYEASSNNNDTPKKPGEFKRKEIRRRLDFNELKFDRVLFERTDMKDKDNIAEIVMLRRWNSFSPGLFRKSEGEILGGGYLLRVNKSNLRNDNNKQNKDDQNVENIVIDPGYNFIQNFCCEGFHIEDIDCIIITHSHLDHCAELLPIMDLIFQVNKRHERCWKEDKDQRKQRVTLCLSRGVYKKFNTYINDQEWQKQLKDVIIIENQPEQKWEPFDGLSITAISTSHLDLGGMNSIGLRVQIHGKEKDICIGFTSDTSWYKTIENDFECCDFLCAHLGSLKYEEIGYNDKIYCRKDETKREISLDSTEKNAQEERLKELKKLYAKSNHLLFFGTDELLKSCNGKKRDRLVILGEFGEELKYGLRVDLCKKLSKEKENIVVLPGDIGLYIAIEKDGTKKVRCDFCEDYVEKGNIETFCYGREDAINYICHACNNTLSDLQKQTFVEHRLTKH